MTTPHFDRVIIQELAWEIAQAKADEHPEKWEKDDSDSSMRRTVVAAMNYHGWPADGIPGLIPLILKILADKEIEAFSTFNDLPCNNFELVKTSPVNWYISGDDANRIRYAMGLDQFMFKGINRGEAVNRRGYEQKQSEKETRRAMGRYTLDEAATFIHQATGQDGKTILKKLTESAKNRTLATYLPGDLIPQERKYVDSWYEAYWDELNQWLRDALPRIVCEFPKPNAPAAKRKIAPEITPNGDDKPWLVVNENDPEPAQSWYTPARYFARQLIKDDSTLLVKKEKLAKKTAASLASVGILKRGNKEPLSSGTVLKSFANVVLN